MSNAVAGHGTLIAMEADPAGSPGVFTTIAELNSDIPYPELIRAMTDVTPHNDSIDSHVSGVKRRGPLTFGVNFIFDDAGHDHSTGLIAAWDAGETRGFRLTGPGAPVSPNDEWIGSGEVSNFQETSPVREGVRSADISVQLSGPMIIDGAAIGTVA